MRKLLIGVLILAVFVAGVAVAVPFVISSELVKQRIVDQITYWTGRKFTFRGDPSLDLYPYLTIRLPEATLSNPGGEDDDPFMTMDAMIGKLELLPLLSGRLEFARFRLLQPRIHLTVDRTGRGNWIMDQGVIGSQIAKGDKDVISDETDPPSGLADVSLGRFVIRDGIVTFDDARTGRHEEFTKVNVSFDWRRSSQAASGDGSLIWRGEPVSFEGRVGQPLDLIAGHGTPLRFTFESTPLEVGFDGAAQQLDGMQLDGAIEMTTPSVRRVVDWLGPTIEPAGILNEGSVTGQVNWLGSVLDLSDASIVVDGNSAEGALRLELGEEAFSLQGTLAFDALDLTRYLELLTVSSTDDSSWLDTPVAWLGEVGGIDLRFSAGEVSIGDMTTEAVAGTIQSSTEQVAIEVGDLDLGESGTAEARLFLSDGQPGLGVAGELQLEGGSMASLLEVFGLPAFMSGTSAISVSFESLGESFREMIRTASGEGTASITDGSLSGLALAEIPVILATGEGTLEGDTSFTQAEALFDVAEGVLSINPTTVVSESIDLKATTEVNLIDGLMMIRGTLASPDPDIAETPFILEGQWGDWRVLPDLGPVEHPDHSSADGTE